MQRVKSLARSFGRRQKRFLVIELLVVAVILCVIAAINW